MEAAAHSPGQGAQRPGMMKDPIDARPAARELSGTVPALLGRDLYALTMEGPERDLTGREMPWPVGRPFPGYTGSLDCRAAQRPPVRGPALRTPQAVLVMDGAGQGPSRYVGRRARAAGIAAAMSRSKRSKTLSDVRTEYE